MIIMGMRDKHGLQAFIDAGSLQGRIDDFFVWFDATKEALQQRGTTEKSVYEKRGLAVEEENGAHSQKSCVELVGSHSTLSDGRPKIHICMSSCWILLRLGGTSLVFILIYISKTFSDTRHLLNHMPTPSKQSIRSRRR